VNVAARMRELGYKWVRQTVGDVVNGRRRLLAEEVFGLAYCLETSISALLSPTDDDKRMQFPSGSSIEASSVARSLRGVNDGSVEWDGDVLARIGDPVYPPGVRPEFDAWPAGEG
jgi:hypothetical protein